MQNTPIINSPWTGLDFEGAGSYGGMEDQPVQVGFAHMHQGVLGETYRSYLYVDRPISPIATRVHRITNEMIQGKPTLPQIWPDFRPWWGQTLIVAHNIPTERKFTSLFHMSGKPIWIDTLKLARAQYPYIEDHTLSGLLSQFELLHQVKEATNLEAHDALYDAIACLYLLKRLLGTPGWEMITPTDIQHISLKQYKNRKKSVTCRARRGRKW